MAEHVVMNILSLRTENIVEEKSQSVLQRTFLYEITVMYKRCETLSSRSENFCRHPQADLEEIQIHVQGIHGEEVCKLCAGIFVLRIRGSWRSWKKTQLGKQCVDTCIVASNYFCRTILVWRNEIIYDSIIKSVWMIADGICQSISLCGW